MGNPPTTDSKAGPLTNLPSNANSSQQTREGGGWGGWAQATSQPASYGRRTGEWGGYSDQPGKSVGARTAQPGEEEEGGQSS